MFNWFSPPPPHTHTQMWGRDLSIHVCNSSEWHTGNLKCRAHEMEMLLKACCSLGNLYFNELTSSSPWSLFAYSDIHQHLHILRDYAAVLLFLGATWKLTCITIMCKYIVIVDDLLFRRAPLSTVSRNYKHSIRETLLDLGRGSVGEKN